MNESDMLLRMISREEIPEPEFLISPPDTINKFTHISLSIQNTRIYFNLSVKNWGNLIKFLQMTKTKKNLPKGESGYNGIYLDKYSKPLITHFKLKKFNFDFVKDKNLLKEIKKRSESFEKNNAKNIKKYLLSDRVCLGIDDVHISMPREKFLRFRNECLKFA